MVKVPKDLQKKKKDVPRRPQAKPARKGEQQYGSRAMRRKMQQQGISMDQIEAKRVIFELEDKTLVLDQPEVFLMKQMGQEIYQVVGSAEEKSLSVLADDTSINGETMEREEISEEDLKPKITEQDIQLVAAQANVTSKEAEVALEQAEGNIAKAIIFLKNKP